MVITSTIYVHHRLHCVRINPSRAFGMHALNAFLSYNRVCEVRPNLKSLVTVGNNINRRDDTSGARYTAANGVLFTMSWNSLCIKAIKYSYLKWLYRNVNQVCRYAANAIACMVVARSQYNHDTKMTVLTRPA